MFSSFINIFIHEVLKFDFLNINAILKFDLTDSSMALNINKFVIFIGIMFVLYASIVCTLFAFSVGVSKKLLLLLKK